MKSFFSKYKWFIIGGLAVIAALVVAFISGGSIENAKNSVEQPSQSTTAAIESTTLPVGSVNSLFPEESESAAVSSNATTPKNSKSAVPATTAGTTSPAEKTTAPSVTSATKATQPAQSTAKATAPAETPKPVEPQDKTISDEKKRCTISISCATLLDNIDKLDEGDRELVPGDGWILSPTTVEYSDGESVFDVLKRVCRDNSIHMEFSEAPGYNSAYIEGIGNLYEFSAGANSGWMYAVNGWYPNYGSSRYAVKSGDNIEWKYTCNLGYDIGGGKTTQ